MKANLLKWSAKLQSYLRIEVWILLFFLAGLENMDRPPIDTHEWRQTLTISISKNFVDHPNILYPRMDIGGATEGIMATEFPIFNYFLAIIYQIFGFHDWYGRLVNWALCCFSLLFLHRMISRSFSNGTANIAILVFCSSIVFQYARKTMPDAFALSIVSMGVYFVWAYLSNGKYKALFGGSILVLLGILSKIPFSVLCVFLIFPFWDSTIPQIRKVKVVGVFVVIGIIVALWYFYWMPHLLTNFGNQLIWPFSIREGYDIVFGTHRSQTWERFEFTAFKNYWVFIFSAFGLAALLLSRKKEWITFWVLFSLVFIFFMVKTGIVFPTHDYYVMPYCVVMAILVAIFFDQLPISTLIKYVCILVLIVPGLKFNKQASFDPPENKYLLSLGEIVHQVCTRPGKLMINSGAFNPTHMYFAGRKGWTVNDDVLSKVEWMNDFRRDGLEYIIQDLKISKAELPYPLIYENEHFRIFDMKNEKRD